MFIHVHIHEKKAKDDPAYQQWVFEKSAARAAQVYICI